MSFMEKVAEAKSEREALLLIAGALDIIDEKLSNPPVIERGDDWASGWTTNFTEDELDVLDALPERMHREGEEYVIPPVSPAVQADRRQFITNYNIPEGDAYVKGGPEWLTAYDTEFVMSLPADARQLMAMDYERRGLSQEAREFAVAFLKGDASNMATAAPLADTLT